MKHHFFDFLDREGDYWTMVPNRQRYAYSAENDIADKDAVKILTISKHHENWKLVFDCPNLEELTLHDPSKEQAIAVQQLAPLKRLRVTFFRTNDIEFIGKLNNVEELMLEYVSGFSDLSPLQKLPKLKSLYIENLRRVTNFDGLRGIDSLRYLHITGTLDWNQPIDNFTFLEGLPHLEVFSLGFIINKTAYPAFLPILHLKQLKKIGIGRSTFKAREYAFLETALPGVKGSTWDLCWEHGDVFEFLGKRTGFVKKNSPAAKERCDEFIETYNQMKKEAEVIINRYRG